MNPVCGFHLGNSSFPNTFRCTKITLSTVWALQKIEVLFEKHKYKIYNSSKTYYIPFIKNYRWHIKSKKNKDIEYSESKINFFENYYFPIGFGKYVSKDYTIKTANYSKKQAEKVLSSKLNNKLAILEQKGYKILAKNVRIVRKKEFYQYKGDVICILPVGKVQYIKDSTLNKIKQEKESVEQTTADR